MIQAVRKLHCIQRVATAFILALCLLWVATVRAADLFRLPKDAPQAASEPASLVPLPPLSLEALRKAVPLPPVPALDDPRNTAMPPAPAVVEDGDPLPPPNAPSISFGGLPAPNVSPATPSAVVPQLRTLAVQSVGKDKATARLNAGVIAVRMVLQELASREVLLNQGDAIRQIFILRSKNFVADIKETRQEKKDALLHLDADVQVDVEKIRQKLLGILPNLLAPGVASPSKPLPMSD